MTALLVPSIDDTPPPDIVWHRGPPTEADQLLPPMRFADVPGILAPQVPTAELLLKFFEDNDGAREDPDGSNRCFVTDWWQWYDAWCFFAASMAANRAGFALNESTTLVPGVRQTHGKGWAYVPAGARCFDDAGWFGTVPVLGSFAIAVWPSSGNWTDPTWGMPGDHVCVPYATLDGGGTSIPWVTNADGDRVPEDPGSVASIVAWDGNISNRIMRSHRTASTYFGYCRLPYPVTVPPPPADRRSFAALFASA